MAEPTKEPQAAAPFAPVPTKASTAQAPDGESYRFQPLEVTDVYGAPAVFASVFVYILMYIAKPSLHVLLAKHGKDKAERGAVIMRATLLPGLLSAAVVDFAPIAAAFGVALHWITAIPVGAIFYAGGAVLIHEGLKKYDPLGSIADRVGMKRRTKEEVAEEANERFREATGAINVVALQKAVASQNKKDAER